jgi:TolB-like protein/Tfp pilus assembly protein PilF
VTLAWIFDVREGRIERTGPAAGGLRGARLAALLAGIGVLAAAPGVFYYFVVRRAPEPRTAGTAPSIAVLPFVNMSSDKENEYFSDGITEELINALANIEGLRVVSRTAVFALKGRTLNVDQIGAQLKVNTLLEGSVRRDGNALRITAQLINAGDGYHLWSKTYDRELKNIFAVEDEIARSIAQALRRALVRSEGVKPSTANLEAHDLYLKGRYFWNKRTLEAFRKAADFFEQATREDPGYALAYTGLADILVLRMDYDVVPTSEFAPKARAAALRALQLDSGLAEAHCSLAFVAAHEFDRPTALREFRTAIELKPDYATAHHWLALLLAAMGRLQEARVEIELALKADPTALIINSDTGDIEYFDRNYTGAAERYRKTLEMDPSFQQAHRALMGLYIVQKKLVEADAELERIPSFPPIAKVGARGIIDAMAGRRQEALAAVREVEEQSKRAYVPPSALAGIWVALGEKDKAFPLLLKACAERDAWITNLKVDPFFGGIRSDPRFAELLKCMNLQ